MSEILRARPHRYNVGQRFPCMDVCFVILIWIYETCCALSCYIDIITHSNSQVFLWEVNDVYVLSFLTEYIRIIMCYRATRIWWRTTSLMYSYENNKTHTSMQVFYFFHFHENTWETLSDIVPFLYTVQCVKYKDIMLSSSWRREFH